MNEQDKRPAQIERDIEQTRADVGATIDAIQSKLTPGQVMDQAIGYVRTSLPADFGRNLADTTRNNPVPVVLIGIGIAWLAMSGRQGSMGRATRVGGRERWSEDEQDDGPSMTERALQATREARERVGERVDDARSALHRIGDRSRETVDHARETVDRARSAVSEMIDDQPLVLGALGLAAGAALGAMLPHTAPEDEWLGPVSDSAKGRAADAARDLADRTADRTRDAMRHAGQASDENRTEPSPAAEF